MAMQKKLKHARAAGRHGHIGERPAAPFVTRAARRNPLSAYDEMRAANRRFLEERNRFYRESRSGGKLIGNAMESALANQRLRQQLVFDPKFGIENDAAFNERLFRFLRSPNSKKPFSFAIVDLDNLKQLNDLQGHDAGDKALSKLAAELNANAGKHNGFACRFGGDEFKILVPKDKVVLSNALKSALQEMRNKGFSFSAGICSSSSVARLSSAQAMVEKLNLLSDKALNIGKKSGKGRITVAG